MSGQPFRALKATAFILFALLTLVACSKENPALNINDLAADPTAYSGTITVTGITAGFAPQDKTLFGVMDKKELQCQSANCNKFLLPVRTQGPLPKLGDEIVLSGTFVKEAGGYTFIAQKVDFVRNHPLGGAK